MLAISPDPPIIVVVQKDRWDAYSLHQPPTKRDEELLKTLHDMGGINEGVKPGTYQFNIAPLDEKNTVVSLEPIRLKT